MRYLIPVLILLAGCEHEHPPLTFERHECMAESTGRLTVPVMVLVTCTRPMTLEELGQRN
jgi:hypothetical protein